MKDKVSSIIRLHHSPISLTFIPLLSWRPWRFDYLDLCNSLRADFKRLVLGQLLVAPIDRALERVGVLLP